MKSTNRKTPSTVDDYCIRFPGNVQAKLQQIRSTIKSLAPDSVETISYNMPLYKWNGMLIAYAVWKEHIGMYPLPRLSKEIKRELTPYVGAKSTLRFPLDAQLPIRLIRKVIELRMTENRKKIEG